MFVLEDKRGGISKSAIQSIVLKRTLIYSEGRRKQGGFKTTPPYVLFQ